ncbi:MAG: class I SAM-dependent DNA methyltransferase [Longimicrobiales bacterium]
MPVAARLRALAERWATAEPGERTNAQPYVIELCHALGVEGPRPKGSGYEFEHPVRIVRRDGTETVKPADLFKEGCFLLEAKDEAEPGEATDRALRRAFGQAMEYASHVKGGQPPYLVVLDVGSTVLLWDRWHGTYGGFQAARRIELPTLHQRPEDIQLLQDVWERPEARDPRRRAEAVTKEIAAHLADLAGELEAEGFDQERVSRFLIRCVFTFFAEDVDLLKDHPFEQLIEMALAAPEEFVPGAQDLWQAMDQGTRFGFRRLLRYNGHFFREAEALPVTRRGLAVLREAARADWSEVEPAIFGTLMTRALDKEERHRLGAEFTPPAYVERLVRVTIEEPVREEWTLVQGEVLQLRASGRPTDIRKAEARLRAFHERLRGIRVLDPACGSGNFLYIAMAVLKRIELEVRREIEALTGHPELALEEVGPAQFHGIEVKPWAREIAELTLWIGFHQWWRRTHGHAQPPEPVLQDTGTLECRDAVLAWDEIREDLVRARPDPTPRIPSAVTGELVPDPSATLPYVEHLGARQAPWPAADFIVGNPPYMGRGRQRDAFGDGYVDALRSVYDSVPDNADYVLYWWYRAAQEVAAGRARRAGLITTNSIRQRHNRAVVEEAAKAGAFVVWAVPDHPWVDEVGSAAVRVSMTVTARDSGPATLVEVDDDAEVSRVRRVPRLNSDLTVHADVPRAAGEPLLANRGLSSQGFILVGDGFVLDPEEGARLSATDPDGADIVRPYLTGKDLTQRRREQYVIDFGLRDHAQVREHPVLYDVVRDRVKPLRDANARAAYRENWWRFGEARSSFRPALAGLRRYIATSETAKHRFFVFLDAAVATSHKVIWIASPELYHLGVLSSAIHVTWALAAGGRLEDRPVYQKILCFDPFPFPDPSCQDRAIVAKIAERLHAHRAEALARDAAVTMTGMYNVVDKLRSGETLTPKERKVHELAACGVLRDLHDELDAAVAACYGWPWPMEEAEILDRLVALHDERAEEERAGRVRWLRPEYQVPRFGGGEGTGQVEALSDEAPVATPAEEAAEPWPGSAVEQLARVKESVRRGPGTAEEVTRRFHGARAEIVSRHLETLLLLAEVHQDELGRYHARD